ncbi:DUF1861 family protein [Metabacillus sp. GX 13764]|uniref:MTP-1 family protein n=1 Tax=Metabacillus kandeliae TaxID=2900151 RepID=UPI001E505053|nr:DUF1861 family protein [Metabacillus kandeliae]MCD7034514.1 DUF1861 family protein [Metabacillus kandeliae]
MKTCAELLTEFQEGSQPFNPEKILFGGVEELDVYNVTAPFENVGESVIAGRVEARDSEESRILFFSKQGEVWMPKENTPVLSLQDPFYTVISGELVIGGVETFPHPVLANALGWRTVFYKGKNLAGLTKFFEGPDGMKDLRLIQLHSGSIGVLTRPQGEKGGRGKIGFTTVASLKDLSVKVIDEAPLLTGQFAEDEWGGANEAHLLSNGMLGILGHIASFDEAGDRHYYPMAFQLNPDTLDCSEIELIAERRNFLPGETKRPDLEDVVFSGGLVRKGDGYAELYAGISDAEAQKIQLEDPFKKYEAEEQAS